MLKTLRRPKTTTNPILFANQLRLEIGDEEWFERIRSDFYSVDLLTWNIFASLDTHNDPPWLAYRMQPLGGQDVHDPLRISLWTGRRGEPLLRPNPGYLQHLRQRVDDAHAEGDLGEFTQPVEVPVRIETPDVLILVDTCLRAYPWGNGGRDRLIELVDVGLDAARQVGKQLAIATVYASGSAPASRLSARMDELRDPAKLRAELPHRDDVPEVILRELPWQQLVRIWEAELGELRLSGQPVKPFLAHLRRLGLR